MSMKKSVAFILALILTLSVLSACSKKSSGDAGGAGDKGSSGGKVEINWLVRTDPSMIDWEKDMIKGT